MSRPFTTIQEQLMNKIAVYQSEVAASALHGEDCPLLRAQLEEIQVLTSRLGRYLGEMLATIREPS